MRPWEFVSSPEELADAIDRLAGSHFLALDTEFIRERTYQSRLCLVQVADSESIFLFDALALPGLSPLVELLTRPTVTTVVHSARQDLEILFQDFARLPATLFDTQVAAVLLGHGEQVAYSALVKEYCQVELDKSATRTDWSKRPLDTRQLDYAADDVRYLTHLYLELERQLVARQRAHWLEEDCKRLCDPGLYTVDPAQAYQRIKGAARLNPQQRQVLAALAGWRETEAMQRNRPRQWIVKDSTLLQLATRQPATRIQLSQLDEMPESVVQRYGTVLTSTVRDARDSGQRPGSHYTVPGPPTPAQRAQFSRLRDLLNQRAAELDIAAGFLAPRRELEQLIRGERDLPMLGGWRREVIGLPLLRELEQP